jgi:GNAT superfamily N-acetyltransferase
MEIEIRPARTDDAKAIAEIHAASWRSTYRGTFSDSYLDGDIIKERLHYWTAQLNSEMQRERGILMAVEDDVCVGFICVCLEGEQNWGPLLDNLHVRSESKGQGIGRRLIEEGRAWVKARGAFERWHLWVVEANESARKFYEHLGWVSSGGTVHYSPDGTPYPVIRYTKMIY